MKKQGFVYIMANNKLVLYIGVTSDLVRRVYEHKQGLIEGFSQKYRLYKLIYFEVFDNIKDAINREKQLKNWHREWKLNLIKSKNPDFKDLYPELIRS
jgi:putative endonuclease